MKIYTNIANKALEIADKAMAALQRAKGINLEHADNQVGVITHDSISAVIVINRNVRVVHGTPACAVNTAGAKTIIIFAKTLSEMGLTKAESAAIIGHEVGHIVNGDFGKGGGRSLEQEIAADKFAVSQYGKAAVIGGLIKLRNLTGVEEMRKEVDARVAAIECE